MAGPKIFWLIKQKLNYIRQHENTKISNFPQRLEETQSELALETMKAPYVFDFIDLKENAREKDLEDALINNITKVLLELGKGFAFVGHQQIGRAHV